METSHSHHLETHSDSYLVKIKPEIKLPVCLTDL